MELTSQGSPPHLSPLPSAQGNHVVVERVAPVDAHVEELAMPLDRLDNITGARPAIGAEALGIVATLVKALEHAPERVSLVETHVGVAVTDLYPDDHVVYHEHARTVVEELLVGPFRIVLLRLDELVVKV